MSGSGLLLQLLNGLADASALFLVAAGLSLIFGVTRVVNFAHGSFYMLGIYLAWTFTGYFAAAPAIGPACCWRRWPPASSARPPSAWCSAASTARPSCSSCWPPSRCCSSSATPRWPCGARKTCSPPAPRPRGRGRDPGPPLPAIRPAAHRRRPDRAGPAVAAADAHALGPAAARRLGEPQHAGRAGREPGLAVHVGLHAGRLPGRPGRRAGRAAATPATSSPAPSWWWWWAAWVRSPAPSWPRC